MQSFLSVALPIGLDDQPEQVVQEGDGRRDASGRDWYVIILSDILFDYLIFKYLIRLSDMWSFYQIIWHVNIFKCGIIFYLNIC